MGQGAQAGGRRIERTRGGFLEERLPLGRTTPEVGDHQTARQEGGELEQLQEKRRKRRSLTQPRGCPCCAMRSRPAGWTGPA